MVSMSRFGVALLAVAVTIALTSLCAASRENVAGSVFFLEGGANEYLRRGSRSDNREESTYSSAETAAAVAVLLGVPPPVMLSAASSVKLDSVLSPNPFKRPRTVVSLSIGGAVLDSLTSSELEGFFKQIFFRKRPFSAIGHQIPFELPGQYVNLQVLNHREFAYDLEELEKKLRSLVLFLGGSYHNGEATDVVTANVPVPLSEEISVSLDLNKRAERKFAFELVSLFDFLESASRQSHNQAMLFMGTYTALQSIDKEVLRMNASKLFFYTSVQVFSALQATFDEEIVGVYSIPSVTSQTSGSPLFTIKETRSSRYLVDSELAPSPSTGTANETTEYDAEVQALIGRSIVVVVTIILIIATGLGSCFLFSMPLTRDTLLYAGAKMD